MIEIISTVDNLDGSTSITFNYGKEFVGWFKYEHPGIRATKKKLSEFFVEILTRAVKKV